MNTNIPESNVTSGQEAIKQMMAGVKVATDPIRKTYGFAGTNAILESDLYPYHQVVNDAEAIIKSMWVKNPVQKVGLDFIKELVDKADKDSREGRKTTCIMGEETLEHGLNTGIKKRELDSLIPFIESEIDKVKFPIDENNVHFAASIAGESEELGIMVGKIYQKIGKEGIIYVEGSGLLKTFYSFKTDENGEMIDSVNFPGTGFLAPSMAYDPEAKKAGTTESKAIYNNPTILVSKRKISTIKEIDPLLQTLLNNNKRDLVIFTDDMDSNVASMLVNTHKSGVLNITIVKAPVLWKNYIFEDFAKVVGASIVEDGTGITFKNLKITDLGTCEKIIIDKDEVVVIGGADISQHIEELKKEGSNDSLLRVSWLNKKTATIKLGANNESELSYKMLKCKDAISTARLALIDGVVEGGGICLYKIADKMPDTVAGNILRKVLKAPAIQQCINAGIDVPDSFGEHVVDASIVIKNAVRNAISLASTILTGDIVINLPPKSTEQMMQESLQAKGMRF